MLYVRNSEISHCRRSVTAPAFHGINASAFLGQSRLTFRIILVFIPASLCLSEISHCQKLYWTFKWLISSSSYHLIFIGKGLLGAWTLVQCRTLVVFCKCSLLNPPLFLYLGTSKEWRNQTISHRTLWEFREFPTCFLWKWFTMHIYDVVHLVSRGKA